MAMVISSLYLAILAKVQPYKRSDDFYLSLISSFLFMVCFALGVLLHNCGPDDEKKERITHCLVQIRIRYQL